MLVNICGIGFVVNYENLFVTFLLLADSDSSDEQQQYLLTAASMVGEAMDDLVSSLTREQSSKLTKSTCSCFNS